MSLEEAEVLPALLSLDKVKRDIVHTEPERQQSKRAEIANVFMKESNKQRKDAKNTEEEKLDENKTSMSQQKIEQFEGRFKANKQKINKKEERQKPKDSGKQRDFQQSKKLIEEMKQQMNFKNVSQSLYPASNETVEALIAQIDEEIINLEKQEERKANSSLLNPTNISLKRQLEALRSSKQRAITIKELYNEKINQRNKIMQLQRMIMTLREENSNLKVKINRGIETIQNHMHNLPCEKQKELIEQLNRVQKDWKKEKQMRQSLEDSISKMVLNFKRIFDEAELARRLIVKQLKEIQEREKALVNTTPYQSSGKTELKDTPELSALNNEVSKRSQKVTDLKDYFPSSSNRTPQKASYSRRDGSMKTQEIKQPTVPVFSMEQQIKKMRNNQLTLKKNRI